LQSTQFSATLQAIAALDQTRYPKVVKYLVGSVPMTWETVCDKSGSRFIESLIQFVGQNAVTAVYDSVFSSSARDAAYHAIANFVLQRWLEFADEQRQLGSVADQLRPQVPDLLKRRPQVVVALTAGLVWADLSHQRSLVEVLVAESHGANLVEFLNALSPPNGSKILQSLCGFNEAAIHKLIEAVKNLGGDRLVEIAED
jgi:hypothetical protein